MMPVTSEARMQKRAARGVALAGLGLLGAMACGDIPIENELPPGGIIEGTVVYTGPLPCTQRGHVLGTAQLLVFNEALLPPPQGLGSSARSVATVAGDLLFSGVIASLPASSKDDDTVRCPPEGSPSVTVSARWSVGPLPAGRYQVRGFYDRDGDFSPVLRIHNLPTAGDVAGGAISNTIQALQGAAPIYQTIEIGVPDANGTLKIPRLGALVDGVTVNLGLVLPTSRPIAHIEAVLDERPGIPESQRQLDPTTVTLPVDMRFNQSPTLNPAQADREFIRLVLRPGVPEAEVPTGLAPPISLQVGPPFTKFYLSARRTLAGAVETTPEGNSPANAELFPQAVFSHLNDRDDPALLTSQSDPAVIASGLVVDERILGTTAALWDKKGIEPSDELRILMRPSVICTRPTDPSSELYLVTPSFRSRPTEKDPQGEAVIGNPAALRANLAARFNKPIDKVKVVEGCLPPGKYGLNLVYGTGQAWSLPNEAGRCRSPLEVENLGNLTCKQEGQPARPLLLSQRVHVTIGGAQEDGYCDQIASVAAANAATNGADLLDASAYLEGIPKVCLTAAEQANPGALREKMTRIP
jgi:hypothetical protein